jgi:hypothetical protein
MPAADFLENRSISMFILLEKPGQVMHNDKR